MRKIFSRKESRNFRADWGDLSTRVTSRNNDRVTGSFGGLFKKEVNDDNLKMFRERDPIGHTVCHGFAFDNFKRGAVVKSTDGSVTSITEEEGSFLCSLELVKAVTNQFSIDLGYLNVNEDN